MYFFNNESGKEYFKSKYFFSKQFKQILDEVGLECNSGYERLFIIKQLIDSIGYNRPVILWMDYFYSSIRTDVFQKEHRPHTLLIYGYEKKQQVFHIIEHTFSEGLDYQPRKISFSDVEASYYGLSKKLNLEYISHMFGLNEINADYYEFGLINPNQNNSDNNNPSTYRFEYIANLHKFKDFIYHGLKTFHDYIQFFKNIINNESYISRNCSNLVKDFSDIITSRKMDIFRIQELEFNDQKLENLLEKIIEEWSLIRARFYKCSLTGCYRIGQTHKLVKRLMLILDNEYEYYNKLYKINTSEEQ